MSNPFANILPRFEEIEERRLSSPLIHAALTHFQRGDCTKEEMLIALVIWYDKYREKRLQEDLDRLMKEPSKMGYCTDGLTFNTLRRGSARRLPEFKNDKGETAHDKADGSDWSPNDWMVAVVGELGEAANVMKKVRRGDLTLEEARPMLTQEYADVVIYLDLLAAQVGIDLGRAVMETFNAKSKKVGSRVRLAADDYHLVPYDKDAEVEK